MSSSVRTERLLFLKLYERLSVNIGGQIGFGLGNNWFAFGGGPDLGFLPLDDYHLVAVIIKLASRFQKFGISLQRPWSEFNSRRKC